MSLAASLAVTSIASASDSALDPIVIGEFSDARNGLPEGWEPLVFDRIETTTKYDLVDEGIQVVRARARASASGLVRPVRVDLRTHPILRWCWRVSHVLERGDVRRKDGDDYAARIYVTFAYDPDRVGVWKRLRYLAARAIRGDLPLHAITYIWANRAPLGDAVDNAYAGSFVKMLPVDTGSTHVGTWRVHERNVYEDFVRVFGEEPTDVNGVALMTDTDDTGEAVTAWYGDLVFLPAP